MFGWDQFEVRWVCSGCGKVAIRYRYPTLCMCAKGFWERQDAPKKNDAPLILCERCTFTEVAPGGVCAYCAWRRP